MPDPALRTRVVIVSPALADANNGNWQTARRWQQMLAPQAVRIVREWPDAAASLQDQVMLALHARRSAASIAAWAAARGKAGLAVVLTGTDLYRDIQSDDAARQSLVLAQRLVVLQECGLEALPTRLRPKASVIFQSTSARQTLAKSPHLLRAVMVGHLREEKSPQTLFEAARLGIGFSLGYAELAITPQGPRHFNSSVLVGKDGRSIGKYRKVHLPGHADIRPQDPFQNLEKLYFEVGDLGFPVFNAFGGKIGMCICNDRRWPETYRLMALKGVELITLGYNTPLLNPDQAQSPEQRRFQNHLCMQAGAYQNST